MNESPRGSVLLGLIGIALGIAAWKAWGPVAGIVIGFLMVGGLGWKIIGGIFMGGFGAARMAANPGMRDASKEFVAAWEERYGPMKRGDRSSVPPAGMFPDWFKTAKPKGVSAGEYLDNLRRPKASVFHEILEPGETIIESDKALDGDPPMGLAATEKALCVVDLQTGHGQRVPYEGIAQVLIRESTPLFPSTNHFSLEMTPPYRGQLLTFHFGRARTRLGNIVKELVSALTVHERHVAMRDDGAGATWQWRPAGNGTYFWQILADHEIENPNGEEFQTWMRETTRKLSDELLPPET